MCDLRLFGELGDERKKEQQLGEQGEVNSTFNMGQAINLAAGGEKVKILDYKKRKKHFEDIVTRHGTELL